MKMLSVPLVISLLETWHPEHSKRQILACYCMLLIVLSRNTLLSSLEHLILMWSCYLSSFHSSWVPRKCGHHSEQENTSGILLSMALPPSMDLTNAKHCLSSMPSQGVIRFISLQEEAN